MSQLLLQCEGFLPLMLLSVFGHALLILVFALICLGLGRAILWRFFPACPPGQRIAMAVALGAGLLGQAFFFLGAAGRLTRSNVLLLLAISAVAGCIPIRKPAAAPRYDPSGAVAIGALLAGVIPSFLLALYPPAGFDATMYHLPFARLFAEAGSLVFADTLRFPVFPQLGEMLFTGSLLVADDVTAQLTQWLALVVTTVATASLAGELAGRKASLLAGALWLGTPLALYLGANAYIDCSLTMYVTLAFAAWHGWKRDAHPGWAGLAGAFAGFAAGTKYHGLFFLLVLFLACVWRHRRAAVVFALVALMVVGPWYARIAAETGNPVFPFFSTIFGQNEWRTGLELRVGVAAANPFHPFETAVRRALLDPIRIGSPPHNPWILLLLPFAFVGGALDRRQRFPLFASIPYLLAVSILDWRFMMVVVPMLSIAIATGLIRLWSSIGKGSPAAAAIAALVLASPGLIWISVLIRNMGPIPGNALEREAFLSRKIPTYDALRFLGRTRREPVIYLLYAENAAYYCPGRCMGDHIGPFRYQLVTPLLGRPDLLAAKLEEFGAEFLVVDRSWNASADLARSAAFRQVFRSGRSEAFEIRKDR